VSWLRLSDNAESRPPGEASGAPVRRIVVVGGGTAGWFAAALLVRRLAAAGTEVCLVESPTTPTIGVGEGSTPHMAECLRILGIPNSEWMPACKATRKMGIRFEGWGHRAFTHPFFLEGERGAFQRLSARRPRLLARLAAAHEEREGFELDDLFLAPSLARDELFQRCLRQLPDRIAWGAFHFDAGLLGAFLRDWAIARGVRHRSADVLGAVRDESGALVALNIDGGERLTGEVFVDCTGFHALLIEKELDEPFVGYDHSLLCDRALAVKLPRRGGSPNRSPHTTSTTLGAGWVWQIPLADALGCGYVFSSAFVSDDEAERELSSFLKRRHGAAAADLHPRLIRFRTGRRRQAWVHNCVSVGLCSNFVEPLEATSIATSLTGVARFILAVERHGYGERARSSYNGSIAALNDAIRDFIAMHYASAARDDTPFWQACHEDAVIPESLSRILDAWRSRGRIELDHDAYIDLSWFCLMTGCGDRPGRGQLASAHDDAEIVHSLAETKRSYLQAYRRWMRQQLASSSWETPAGGPARATDSAAVAAGVS